MQILVPLDGSAFSEQALESACELAQRLRGDLHLVRVHEQPGVYAAELAASYDHHLYQELWQAASEYIGRQAVKVSRIYGLATHSATLNGPVATALAAYVARAHINLVVMASHGRSGLGRALLGSTAAALTHSLTVPLLLLRPHKMEGKAVVPSLQPQRILIPLDGSEFAEQILDAAVELGWPAGAEYTLLQVVKPQVLDTYATAVAAQMDNHEIEHLNALAEASLARVADKLRAVGLRVQTMVVTHPDAAAGIIDAATACKADLIAMATHGRSGWKRLTLGSVAQQVLHTARLPLLLLNGSALAAGEVQAAQAPGAVGQSPTPL